MWDNLLKPLGKQRWFFCAYLQPVRVPLLLLYFSVTENINVKTTITVGGGRNDCVDRAPYQLPHPPLQKTATVLADNNGVKIKLVCSDEKFFDNNKLIEGKSYHITSLNVRGSKDTSTVTLNPIPWTLNPKPQTLSPTPFTLNPKP